jgi:hypothetical protein
VPAKLVVTASNGGSRIALVSKSGKELLASVVFSEPRAKGATLRSLKALLGADVVVEDHTVSPTPPTPRPSDTTARSTTNGTKAGATGGRKPVSDRRSRTKPRVATVSGPAPTAKATKTAKRASS